MAIIIDNHTKILLHGDKLTDSSKFNVPITNDGVTIGNIGKFGGSSLYFNGSSKLTFPQSTFKFASNDFTVEWWEYSTSTNNGSRFCSEFTSNTCGGLLLGYQGIYVYASSVIQLTWDLISGAIMLNVTPNQWVHWAVVRNGTSFKTYRNGTLYASATINGSIVYNESYAMSLGDYRSGDHSYWNGYIDEFRIVDYAVYKSNFTPPTEAYTSSIGKAKINREYKNLSKSYVKINGIWKSVSKILAKENMWGDAK